MKTKSTAADRIDDIVVSHMLKKSSHKYGSFIDLDEFEKYRVVLTKA